MHVSSASRIKPRIDLCRHGFQSVRRTRVSTPVENRNAIKTLEQDRQLRLELESAAHFFHARPPPALAVR